MDTKCDVEVFLAASATSGVVSEVFMHKDAARSPMAIELPNMAASLNIQMPTLGDDASVVALLHAALGRGEISERTVENYLGTLKRIKACCQSPPVPCSPKDIAAGRTDAGSYRVLLTRPGVTYDRLLDNINTYKTLEVTLAHIMGIMKHVGLKDPCGASPPKGGETPWFCLWRGAYEHLKADTQASRDAGEPTERQQRGHLDWDQVMAKNEELRRTKEPGDMDALLSAMYTEIPPRR
jgi:hypothetical protein